jgi:predicted Zn-dependent protease
MSGRRGEPIRLLDSERILSRAECEAIARRAYNFASGGGETRVAIQSWWQGELRWARNRVSLASDRRDIVVTIERSANIDQETRGVATTNQLDDASLRAAVGAAERWRLFAEAPPPEPFHPARPAFTVPASAIWSDATYALTTESRSEVARALIAPTKAKGMLSAGYLEVRAGTSVEMSSAVQAGEPADWETPYAAWTQAQCSLTVRNQKGSGSGWAGLSTCDWGKIDVAALGERALEKCLASQSPVALEPGRYTVILEPQAVCDLLAVLTDSLQRKYPENGEGPFMLANDDALRLWRTKLGLKVADERVTLSHSYADPLLGIVPQLDRSHDEMKWIDRGVLQTLSYDRPYALGELAENEGRRDPIGFRMSGGDTSIEEMIRTTQRGLLVTRFSNVNLLDATSLLSTGVTRDGLWLIENGKITKAVKNFRFTESPLFVLNSLEQLGEAVPVFHVEPWSGGEPTPAVVPPLKARDFSFTSTIDAI